MVSKTSLLWSEHDLAVFCDVVANDPDQQIVRITQLSSKSLGQSDGWELADVVEVWEARERATDYTTIILIGSNQEPVGSHEGSLDDVEMVAKLFPKCLAA